jgi:hypothetical protein
MKLNALIAVLKHLGGHGRWAVADHTLRLFFKDEDRNTFNTAISRHVRSGILSRVSPGLYLNPYADRPTYALEHLSSLLRPYDIFYLSLESVLHDSGYISQIPSRLTFMTTGSSYTYNTPIGTIEFIHTRRPVDAWLPQTIRDEDRGLRVATPALALEDLRRVGRSQDLISNPTEDDDEADFSGNPFLSG